MPARPKMLFQLPSDKEFLAAVGRVALAHAHLDYILRMTVKTLADLDVEEAMRATAALASAEVRKLISKLAREKLKDTTARLKLEALIEDARQLTEQRNEVQHGVAAIEDHDGPFRFRGRDHQWRDLPTTSDLEEISLRMISLTHRINEARLGGFLTVALEAAKPQSITAKVDGRE